MKYYKTGSYNELIKEVEVSRETDKSLYIKNKINNREEKVLKRGMYHNYFTSYENAKHFLKTTQSRKIELLQDSLECEIIKLKKIKEL